MCLQPNSLQFHTIQFSLVLSRNSECSYVQNVIFLCEISCMKNIHCIAREVHTHKVFLYRTFCVWAGSHKEEIQRRDETHSENIRFLRSSVIIYRENFRAKCKVFSTINNIKGNIIYYVEEMIKWRYKVQLRILIQKVYEISQFVFFYFNWKIKT